MSKIPVDNGSSLNKLITLKLNVPANITLIERSVSVVYLLVYYSIYYPHLLCTSCDVSKICLPPMYIPIAFSPNDQIPPKFCVSINSTNIYISSDKFVLIESISGKVRVDPARYRKYITGMDRRSVVTRIFYAIKEV
jgi:hypothetical protein